MNSIFSKGMFALSGAGVSGPISTERMAQARGLQLQVSISLSLSLYLCLSLSSLSLCISVCLSLLYVGLVTSMDQYLRRGWSKLGLCSSRYPCLCSSISVPLSLSLSLCLCSSISVSLCLSFFAL